MCPLPAPSPARVIITGFGLVTPLGQSAWQTFRALREGRTLADRLADLPESVSPIDLARAIGCVRTAQHTPDDPAVELAEQAAREALYMAGADPVSTPCILGVSKGATHAFADAASALTRSGPSALGTERAQAIALGPHGYLAHQLSRRLGSRVTHQYVAACASSLVALHQARLALLHPPAMHPPLGNRILVLTAEASLTEFFLRSYLRLGVLPQLSRDTYRCRPLDQRREGFVLSQIAAAIVLERRDNPPRGSIELVDTAVAAEAHDLIRTNPQMPALSDLGRRLLANREIDLIHPHATGTVDHDPSELASLAPSLKDQTDAYAVKGAIGHGLGAAGLASLVIACLCNKTGQRPPMPWLDHPVQLLSDNIAIRSDSVAGQCTTQAVFAAGFGGHVAGAVVRGDAIPSSAEAS